MGSPHAFEFRRLELQRMLSSHNTDVALESVDDDLVLNSFLQLVHPTDGLITEYLRNGVIALILGDTLFVHGGIHDYNAG